MKILKPLNGIRLPVGMLPVGDYPLELYVELYSYSPFAYSRIAVVCKSSYIIYTKHFEDILDTYACFNVGNIAF